MKILHIWSQQQCFWICKTVWEVSLKSLLRNSKTSRCFPFKCDSFCDCFRKQFFLKSPFMIFKMSFLKKNPKKTLQIRSVNCGGKYTFSPHIYSRLLKRLKTLKSLSSRFGSLTVDLTGQFGSSFGDFFFLLLSAVISCLTLVIYGYFALLWSCHASLWSYCILLWLFEAI